MIKKWLKPIAALLALCISLTCTACSKEGISDNEATAESTAEATAEAKEEIKIGYIFHGEVDNPGFTAEMNEQRIKAMSHSSVVTCYIDNVNISDFENAVKTLVNAGCSKIVTCSSVYTHVLTSVAGKYMNVDFIGYGARVRAVNVYAYTDMPFQGAYAAGMAAAYNSETEKVGIVCDPDMLYSIPVINAAALGMQLVYSDAAMKVAFATKPEEIDSAVTALQNEGCDVIICYTESSEAADCCERRGIKFIDSVNHAGNADSYKNMLMYFYCSRDSFFLSQFKEVVLDTWEASSYVGTIANGIVNVSDARPAAKEGTQDILEALIPNIAAGRAYIFEGELKDTTGAIKYMQNTRMDMAEVYDMTWYVLGVEIVENFRQPITELESNELKIQY